MRERARESACESSVLKTASESGARLRVRLMRVTGRVCGRVRLMRVAGRMCENNV